MKNLFNRKRTLNFSLIISLSCFSFAANSTAVPSSIYDSAGKAMDTGTMGAAVNGSSGQTYDAAAAACSGTCTAAMKTLAYISYAQAAVSLWSAYESRKTKGSAGAGAPIPVPSPTDFDGDPNPQGDGPPDPTKPPPGTDPLTTAVRTALDKFKKEGFKLNPDGSVTTPDGTNLKPKDVSTAAGLANLGMSSADAGKVLGTISKVNEDAMKKAKALLDANAANVTSMELDGGGGFRGPASEDGGSSTSFDDYLKALKDPFGAKGAALRGEILAGKTKTHGDDQIGVSMEDIFTMVHRRYQERRAADDFIEPAAAPGPGKATLVVPKRGR